MIEEPSQDVTPIDPNCKSARDLDADLHFGNLSGDEIEILKTKLATYTCVGNCWEWKGRKEVDGYGVFDLKLSGRPKRIYKAHRVSWFINRRESPFGKCVLHRCDNPACFNPAHLFLGTQHDNIRDMVSKGRQTRKGGGLGKDHGMAKINDDTVKGIVKDAHEGTSYEAVARRYGVSAGLVSQIMCGTIWNHVTGFSESNRYVRKTGPTTIGGDTRFSRRPESYPAWLF